MFSDNTVAKAPILSDLEVLFKNQTPIARHFKESGNGAFTVEAVLRGKNAEDFFATMPSEKVNKSVSYHEMMIPYYRAEMRRSCFPESTWINAKLSLTFGELGSEKQFVKYAYKPLKYFADLNPIISGVNYTRTIFTGENIYGDKASIEQRYIGAPVGLVLTFVPGVGNVMYLNTG